MQCICAANRVRLVDDAEQDHCGEDVRKGIGARVQRGLHQFLTVRSLLSVSRVNATAVYGGCED